MDCRKEGPYLSLVSRLHSSIVLAWREMKSKSYKRDDGKGDLNKTREEDEWLDHVCDKWSS